jgi:hypothetical protein
MSEKEYVELRLPKYPGIKFRRFTVEEYYAIFELDCLPEGTSQELWDGIILEKYTDMNSLMCGESHHIRLTKRRSLKCRFELRSGSLYARLDLLLKIRLNLGRGGSAEPTTFWARGPGDFDLSLESPCLSFASRTVRLRSL